MHQKGPGGSGEQRQKEASHWSRFNSDQGNGLDREAEKETRNSLERLNSSTGAAGVRGVKGQQNRDETEYRQLEKDQNIPLMLKCSQV